MSLFDVLDARLAGARVLDLYAGAGALAIEALSRGALSAVLVEKGRPAADAIRRNLAELDLERRTELVQRDVLSALAKREDSFDVIFADPPYRSNELERLLFFLGSSALLANGGVVVVEHHHKRELAERYHRLTRTRRLKAGESCFTLYHDALHA